MMLVVVMLGQVVKMLVVLLGQVKKDPENVQTVCLCPNK